MHLPIMTVIMALPPPPPGPVTLPLSSPTTAPCMAEVSLLPPYTVPIIAIPPATGGWRGTKDIYKMLSTG